MRYLWLLILLGGCLIVSGGDARAEEPPVGSFVQYEWAQANLNWLLDAEDRQEEEAGVLRVYLPNRYAFVYADDSERAGQKLLSYAGIVGSQYRGRWEYSYTQHHLFQLYEDVFVPLAFIQSLPGSWTGLERMAGRPVYGYRTDGETPVTYWLDQQTGIPLRIQLHDGRDFLTTSSYRLDQEKQELQAVSLVIHAEDYDGKLHLENVNGYWFPAKIQISTEEGQAEAVFSEWQILDQQADDFSQVQTLSQALEAGQKAHAEGRWEAVIENYRTVLRIDPFFSTGYFYLAFAYGALDSYLGAVENYQQLIMLEPDNAAALNNLAYTYMLRRIHLQEALELAQRAVEFDPRPAYLDTLGYGHYLTGSYEEALDCFLQALDGIDEELKPEIYEHIVLTYQALGQEGKAAEYQQYLDTLEGDG